MRKIIRVETIAKEINIYNKMIELMPSKLKDFWVDTKGNNPSFFNNDITLIFKWTSKQDKEFSLNKLYCLYKLRLADIIRVAK